MKNGADETETEIVDGGQTAAPAQETEVAAGATATADEVPGHPWAPSPPQVHRYKDAEAVAEAAARRFLDTAKRAVEKFDNFVVVLSGGSTPRLLYKRLTEPPYRQKVPWSRTFFVFGDERCVPPDDEQSNYRMVRETLFEPLEIPELRVLRMKGEDPPADAARRYETRLGDLFLLRPKRSFDLVLLGIGTDGHTASLFPGTKALEEESRWVAANHLPSLDTWRLTLTLPALNAAKRIIFLATGESKAQVIAEAFGGLPHDEPYPCERIAPLHVRREVLVDRDAASKMPHDGAPEEDPHADDDEDAGDDAALTGAAPDDNG